MRKFFCLIICIMLMGTILGSCKKNENNSTSSGDYDRDAGLNANASTAFFDDFTDPSLSSELWYVRNSKWGPDFNHGVRPENVLWNDSGVVTLKSYGQYYKDSSKTCQGGVLITKDTYGPGRYEAKMKLLPRFGGCTAFWTFMYGNFQDLEGNSKTDLNQEIDIELNVGESFKNAWFTNWVTVDDSAHAEKVVPSALNDGEWHIYTFEWHTSPMRVDYYIDNVHYYTSYSYVPYVAGTINIGNWFPDGWAGTPDFEEDYMQLDYVSFTPYKGQPCIPSSGGNAESPFPTVSTPLPKVANLISNAGFENAYANNDTAWKYFNDCAIVGDGAGKAMKLTAAENEQAVASQIISGASEGFEYTLTAKAKGDGEGSITVWYLKNSTEYLGSAEYKLKDLTDEYGNVTLEFTAPKDCMRLEVTLNAVSGTLFFDDLFVNLTKLI